MAEINECWTLVRQGYRKEQIFVLDPEMSFVTIGRTSECDLQCKEKDISRKHLEIHRYKKSEDDESFYWRILDISSTADTFLNGVKVPKRQFTPLKNNDLISLGSNSSINHARIVNMSTNEKDKNKKRIFLYRLKEPNAWSAETEPETPETPETVEDSKISKNGQNRSMSILFPAEPVPDLKIIEQESEKPKNNISEEIETLENTVVPPSPQEFQSEFLKFVKGAKITKSIGEDVTKQNPTDEKFQNSVQGLNDQNRPISDENLIQENSIDDEPPVQDVKLTKKKSNESRNNLSEKTENPDEIQPAAKASTITKKNSKKRSRDSRQRNLDASIYDFDEGFEELEPPTKKFFKSKNRKSTRKKTSPQKYLGHIIVDDFVENPQNAYQSSEIVPEISEPVPPEIPKLVASEITKPTDPEISKPAAPEIPKPAAPEISKPVLDEENDLNLNRDKNSKNVQNVPEKLDPDFYDRRGAMKKEGPKRRSQRTPASKKLLQKNPELIQKNPESISKGKVDKNSVQKCLTRMTRSFRNGKIIPKSPEPVQENDNMVINAELILEFGNKNVQNDELEEYMEESDDAMELELKLSDDEDNPGTINPYESTRTTRDELILRQKFL